MGFRLVRELAEVGSPVMVPSRGMNQSTSGYY